MLRLIGAVSAAAFVFLSAETRNVRSAETPFADANCGDLQENVCPGEEHYPHKNPHTEGAGRYGEHSDCEECWSDLGAVGCHQATCSGSGFLAPEQSIAYVEAQGAATRGDVEAILRVGDRAGGMVAFNTSRQTVQIISCDGARIAANFSLPSEALRKRASGLPEVTSQLQRFAQQRAASVASAAQ